MIALWIVLFWENLKCPNKFNLIELGAGNGEMMKVLIESFQRASELFTIVNILVKLE